MAWPYPGVVAHRGGGSLAPENTLAALRLGASLGFKGVEFDVMLAGDGTPVLIHDETTDRTTGVKGEVAKMSFAQLSELGVPSFEEAGRLCRELGLWANVEIKPARGHERATGEAAARMARELWRGANVQPLLSSFWPDALAAARAAAPELARGFIVREVAPGWLEEAKRVKCVSVHCGHKKLTEPLAKEVKAAGYALACWTVNEPALARRLLGWGADCIITDALRDIGPGFA
ncbi:MAG: glycerophosphodiester phosphodiesterase [Clostridia bacterium]